MMTLLGRRGFGSLLLATAGAVVVRPGFGLGATDDPPLPRGRSTSAPRPSSTRR